MGMDASAEERLKTELSLARDRHERAKASFDLAANASQEIGLDHPDGAHGMLKASQEYNLALRQYSDAVERYCQFLLKGKKQD
jgi:hypothetical protein